MPPLPETSSLAQILGHKLLGDLMNEAEFHVTTCHDIVEVYLGKAH
jgi:hypothetical protein